MTNPSELPPAAAEILEWLELNRQALSQSFRHLPTSALHNARATWKDILSRLQTDPALDAQTLLSRFVESLLDLPGVVPSEFNGYLLPGGRRPTLRLATDLTRRFKENLLFVLNETVDAEETAAGAATITRPATSGAAVPAAPAATPEARA